MKKTKLAKAVTLAILSLGAASNASAHVMYNTFVGAGDSGTDGWTYGGVGNPGFPNVSPGWLGTASSTTLPFGYAGKGWLNWAAAVHHNGTLEVSAAQAASAYSGAVVDIDTNKGSWNDDGQGDTTNPEGWAHNTDIGLIRADSNLTLTLNLTNVDGTWSNYGITVFEGMSGSTGSANHHATWNTGWTSSNDAPANANNPFGLNGLTHLVHDATVGSDPLLKGLTFNAEAGKVYTVLLGGHEFGSVFGPTADYKLSISAVPVPGAVWLFGSAMAGLIGFGRRNVKSPLKIA